MQFKIGVRSLNFAMKFYTIHSGMRNYIIRATLHCEAGMYGDLKGQV